MADTKKVANAPAPVRGTLDDLSPSVGAFTAKPYSEPKGSGVQTRGNGAATKGKTARGPMA